MSISYGFRRKRAPDVHIRHALIQTPLLPGRGISGVLDLSLDDTYKGIRSVTTMLETRSRFVDARLSREGADPYQSSRYRGSVDERVRYEIDETYPPPPIPAIALATISASIDWAKPQRIVPDPVPAIGHEK